MTDTKEQSLPVAVEKSAKADAPATNGTAGRAAATRPPATKTPGGSLSSKLLPELQQIAGGLGLPTKMKKSDLVAAIQAARAAGNGAPAQSGGDSGPAAERPARRERPARDRGAAAQGGRAPARAAISPATPISPRAATAPRR